MVVALVLLGTLSGYVVGGVVLWSTGSPLSAILAGMVTGIAVMLFAAAARALPATLWGRTPRRTVLTLPVRRRPSRTRPSDTRLTGAPCRRGQPSASAAE